MNALTPMTEDEYLVFLEKSIPEFAADKVASGQWQASEALALSRQGYAELLPQGITTPDHHLYTVRDPATGSKVGVLWFGEQERGGKKVAFVYDIVIDAEHQRKGHASRAFTAMEAEVRRRGLAGIGLHVFGHNAAARALYARLGYTETNIQMFKPLAG